MPIANVAMVVLAYAEKADAGIVHAGEAKARMASMANITRENAGIAYAGVANAGMASADMADASVASASVANANLDNAGMADAGVANTGRESPAGTMPVWLMPVWPMPVWLSQYVKCRCGQWPACAANVVLLTADSRCGDSRYRLCRKGRCQHSACQ